jgi:cytochrome c biogenesis protein CcmG/thiol:disulfide interchange protein DsbE
VSRKALAVTLAALALVAVLVIGLRQAPETKQSSTGGESHPLDAAAVRAKLAGAPAPLASLHRRANVLLPGSTGELDRQLAAVKGHPAVVNVWAAWCGPCLVEFPAVQQASLTFGKQVAFLGVDYQDNRDRAVRQLRRVPLTYPSVEDPKGATKAKYKLLGPPTTVFYDRTGKQTFVHSGAYPDQQALEQDIRRYALGA